jgi:hypothetical protein
VQSGGGQAAVDSVGEVVEVPAVACVDGPNQDFGPGDSGQFGDRGDVKAGVESIGVGEQEVRAQRDVDGVVIEWDVRSDAARYRSGWAAKSALNSASDRRPLRRLAAGEPR